MPELLLRAGLSAAKPDVVMLAVVIDPKGSLGERAVAMIGDYCYPDEDDGVAYVLQTDAWADRRVEDGVLTVDFLVYPPDPGGHSDRVAAVINETNFPDRSPRDPDAVRVLRVTGAAPDVELPEETLVFLEAPPDVLTEDDMPLLFAPPPEGD